MNVITTVSAEVVNVPSVAVSDPNVVGSILVQTAVKVEMRESKRFERLKDALDFIEGKKSAILNVDLSTAKYDVMHRLLAGDFPWVVSWPKPKES